MRKKEVKTNTSYLDITAQYMFIDDLIDSLKKAKEDGANMFRVDGDAVLEFYSKRLETDEEFNKRVERMNQPPKKVEIQYKKPHK